VVTNISIQPLDTGEGDYQAAVKEGLSALSSSLRLGGADVVTSLPAEFSITKKIALDRDEADVRGALEWELGQHVIGAMEEYVFDFQRCTHQEHPERQEYLAVGYRSSSVDRITALLRTHKLHPLIVDLDLFALINIHEINYGDMASEPTQILCADQDKAKLVLTRGGDFFDAELVEYDTNELSAQSFCATVGDATSRLQACNEGFVSGSDSLRTYITGPLFTDAAFAGEVLEGLNNAETLHPFRKITCSAGMSEEDLGTYSPQLAVAVGLAMRGADEVE
jgi:Tfp pilus assembly PilM family ATPase